MRAGLVLRRVEAVVLTAAPEVLEGQYCDTSIWRAYSMYIRTPSEHAEPCSWWFQADSDCRTHTPKAMHKQHKQQVVGFK